MLALLAVSIATIEGRRLNNPIAVHAFESFGAATSLEQTASPDPRAPTWEYKIVTGAVPGVVRVTVSGGEHMVGPNVEEAINRYAAQGYVVESFKAFESSGGSGAQFTVPPQIIVLLKRIRK